MNITIYDYANKTKQIALPDKEISEIVVVVLSGDETGYVKFTDGTKVKFDASDDRFTSYYDGAYTVEGENIRKWIDFKSSGYHTISYGRQRVFDTEDENDNEFNTEN